MLLLYAPLLLAFAIGAKATTCDTCTATYNNGLKDDNTQKCMAIKTYLSCLEQATSVDKTNCNINGSHSTAIQRDYEALPSTACPLTNGCKCQYDFFITDMTASDSDHCTGIKMRIDCLKGETDASCDEAIDVRTLARNSEIRIGKVNDCPFTPTCRCELNYAKSDISGNSTKCTSAKTFLGCLHDLYSEGCDGTHVTGVTAEAGSLITSLGADCDITGTVCECTLIYGMTNRGARTPFCEAQKDKVTCLLDKVGFNCRGWTLKDEAVNSISQISNIQSCKRTNACYCQFTFLRTLVTSPTVRCTAAKNFVGCLRDEIDGGCNGTAVVDLAAIIESVITDIGAECAISTTVCQCELIYAKSNISTDDNKCKALLDERTCFVGKTGMSCDGTKNLTEATTVTATAIEAISRCDRTDTCHCELDYSDDTTNTTTNSDKCTAAMKFIECLKGKTATGCNDTTVADLVTATTSTMTGLGADCVEKEPQSDTCDCEDSYTAAVKTTNADKCSAAKHFVGCLKGKTARGCSGVDVTDLAATMETTIAALGADCDISATVCHCDLKYAMSNISTEAEKCTAMKNKISCLIGKTGKCCDGDSTLKQVATNTKAAIDNLAICLKSDTCVCEIAYITSTMTTNAAKCTAAKVLTTCMRDSLADGCGVLITKNLIGDEASAVITALGETECPLSGPCACELAFNAHIIIDKTAKCTSSSTYTSCLRNLGSTTRGCDGTVTVEQLITSHTNSDMCSAAVSGMVAPFAVVIVVTVAMMM